MKASASEFAALGVAVGAITTAFFAFAQPIDCEVRSTKPAPTDRQKIYESKLRPLHAATCDPKADIVKERTACNVFVANALELLYGNTDFGSSAKGYQRAGEIAVGLSQPGNAAAQAWEAIGSATDQQALIRAQDLANKGRIVIAAREGYPRNSPGPGEPTVGAGHIVLILPGSVEIYKYGSNDWGTLQTPNSASYFLDRPDKMYLGCPLSTAWRKPDNKIVLFTKKPSKWIIAGDELLP